MLVLVVSMCLLILIMNTVVVYYLKYTISDIDPKFVGNKQIVEGKYRSWYFSLFYLNKNKKMIIFIYPLPFYLKLFSFDLEYSTGSLCITTLNTSLYIEGIKFKWWLSDQYNKGVNNTIFEKNESN